MAQQDPPLGPATEQAVGIVEFVGDAGPISGILRHRWRDFQVHEIDSKGNIAVLTDVKPLMPVVKEGVELTEGSIEEVAQEFSQVAGEVCGQALKQFLKQVLQGKAEGKVPDPLVLPEEADKDKRRVIHTFLKSNAKLPLLVTDSVSAPGSTDQSKKHCIRAALKSLSRKQGVRDDRAKRQHAGGKRSRDDGGDQSWGGGAENKYLKFVLYKENMDTHAAVGVLCRMLRVQNGIFAMAGTKDKRGVTSQFVTAFQLDSVRLSKLNPHLRGVRVGNFQYCKTQLRLGNLTGNQFKIIMRNVTAASTEQVETACKQLTEKGFVNYFGLQRFGTGSVSTYRIGAALLKGDWQKTVELIMAGPAEERSELVAARKLFLEKGDPQMALDVFPKFMVAERAVLEGIRRTGAANYVMALLSIPRTLRMIYIHSYQSYLWNHAVTHRLATYGRDRAVAGDLVLLRTDKKDAGNGPAPAAEDPGTAPGGEDLMGAELPEDCLDWETTADRLSAVHVVTEEEANSNKFSIYDVVLPIPGSEVVQPRHDTAKVYQEIASKDGLDLEKSPHKVHDFSLEKLTGDYRLILQKASDVSWKLINYSDPNDDSITSTDWEQLQGCTAPCDACITSEPRDVKRLKYTHPGEVKSTTAQNAGDSKAGPGEPNRKASKEEPNSNVAPVAECADSAIKTVPPGDGEAGSDPTTATGTAAAGVEVNGEVGEKTDAADEGAWVGVDGGLPAGTPSAMEVDKEEQSKEGKQPEKVEENPSGVKDVLVGGQGVNGTSETQKLLALELQFSLPSSSYATMVIRELTKECTSKAFHRALTAQGGPDLPGSGPDPAAKDNVEAVAAA